ncbi:roadblock/LC7 domain-containing protein [Ectopseudomonas oleovorans]|uniref:roadblock/LC7 domain-containing protein n=1 Tax=Ectopseudomonas oleovorans TaxID=301 RepID=UPI0035B4BA1B
MTTSEVMRMHCEQALDQLMQAMPGVSTVLIATTDGFEVAARTRSAADIPRMAAMACSMSALGAMAGVESGQGACLSVTVEAREGYVVIVEIPNPAMPMILQVMAPSSEVLGQIVYLARNCAQALARTRG